MVIEQLHATRNRLITLLIEHPVRPSAPKVAPTADVSRDGFGLISRSEPLTHALPLWRFVLHSANLCAVGWRVLG
jgi:hypothetical protein